MVAFDDHRIGRFRVPAYALLFAVRVPATWLIADSAIPLAMGRSFLRLGRRPSFTTMHPCFYSEKSHKQLRIRY
jgi:hypothetical protein